MIDLLRDVLAAVAHERYHEQDGRCGRCRGPLGRDCLGPDQPGAAAAHIRPKRVGLGVELLCCSCEPECDAAAPPTPRRLHAV